MKVVRTGNIPQEKHRLKKQTIIVADKFLVQKESLFMSSFISRDLCVLFVHAKAFLSIVV